MPHLAFRRFLPPLVLLLLPFLASCAREPWRSSRPQPCVQTTTLPTPPVDRTERELRILVTNDVHGYVLEDPVHGRIGYALLKGYETELRNRGYATYLLDAGDAVSGGIYAQFDSGRSIAGVMGKMGYRVITPGNHAFDFNAAKGDPEYYYHTLLPIVSENSTQPFGVSSLNVTRNGTDLPGAIRDAIVIHDGTGPGGDGLRVAVIGLTTPYAASGSAKRNVEGYDFGLVKRNGDPDHAATRAAIMEMLARAAAPFHRPGDVVVVLSHIGWDTTEDFTHGEVSGKDLALVPNVDVVVDAHTHKYLPPEKIGGAWHGNAGRYLEGFAEIAVKAGAAGAETTLAIRRHADVAAAAPDPTIAAMLQSIGQRLGLHDELFVLPPDGALSDKGLDEGSTALGRFLCRAMLEAAGADLALHNAGGIRSGLAAGPVTIGMVRNMIPFTNNLLVFPLTGGEIQAMLEAMPRRGMNDFPQFFGMTVYAWEEKAPSARSWGVAGILDGEGQPIDLQKTYTVAINEFISTLDKDFPFVGRKPLADKGDLNAAVIQILRERADPGLDGIRNNGTFFIFPDRAAAEAAWEKARGDKRIDMAA